VAWGAVGERGEGQPQQAAETKPVQRLRPRHGVISRRRPRTAPANPNRPPGCHLTPAPARPPPPPPCAGPSRRGAGCCWTRPTCATPRCWTGSTRCWSRRVGGRLLAVGLVCVWGGWGGGGGGMGGGSLCRYTSELSVVLVAWGQGSPCRSGPACAWVLPIPACRCFTPVPLPRRHPAAQRVRWRRRPGRPHAAPPPRLPPLPRPRPQVRAAAVACVRSAALCPLPTDAQRLPAAHALHVTHCAEV
jgi:hypothetical protein